MINLDTLREKIDGTDREIVALFERRMELCRSVAEYKRENGLPVFHPDREQQVLEKCVSYLQDDCLAGYARELFSYLMAASRHEQFSVVDDRTILSDLGIQSWDKTLREKPTVAYYGAPGSYSGAAAGEYFRGKDVTLQNYALFPEVFDAVESGACDYGVLPVENSSTGGIADVLDLLCHRNCYIVGERVQKIEHCLFGTADADVSSVTEVYSHEQGILQCSDFLSSLKGVQPISYYNTAMSAQYVSQMGDPRKACIAGMDAGRCYGLKLLRENIGNTRNNQTRFVVIARTPVIQTASNKISLVFTIPHESGSLYRILSHFASCGVNMTKIESRPVLGSNFEYRFFVDILGNIEQGAVKSALSCTMNETTDFQFLGNYPAAD